MKLNRTYRKLCKIYLQNKRIEEQQKAMKKLIRISKPGLRKYADSKTLPRVINGLGIAILSTSKGVITDKEARNLNVGGEVICHVY